MSQYTAQIIWERGDQAFLDNRYSRKHLIRFDGGVELPASSSVHSVPAPLSDPTAVDPEELFVAAISNCHMLWFLSIAARQGFRVDRYLDTALGVLEKDSGGKMAMTKVTLRPEVQFSGLRLPARSDIERMHHEAHEACYIANSVKSEVRCDPTYAPS